MYLSEYTCLNHIREIKQQPAVCLSACQNKTYGKNSYLFLLISVSIVTSQLAEIAQQRNTFGQAGKSRECANTGTSSFLYYEVFDWNSLIQGSRGIFTWALKSKKRINHSNCKLSSQLVVFLTRSLGSLICWWQWVRRSQCNPLPSPSTETFLNFSRDTLDSISLKAYNDPIIIICHYLVY